MGEGERSARREKGDKRIRTDREERRNDRREARKTGLETDFAFI